MGKDNRKLLIPSDLNAANSCVIISRLKQNNVAMAKAIGLMMTKRSGNKYATSEK
jgi:hypothetical protein